MPTVAMEEDGPDMTKLEKQLTELRTGSKFKPTPRRPFWSLMYLIPDHHNPTGTSISEGDETRRSEIVGCATPDRKRVNNVQKFNKKMSC